MEMKKISRCKPDILKERGFGRVSLKLLLFSILQFGEAYVFEKNNIFAFVNIAKVSSCGNFNEFCLFFAGSVTV